MTNDRITGPCPECERLRAKLQAAEAEVARLTKNNGGCTYVVDGDPSPVLAPTKASFQTLAEILAPYRTRIAELEAEREQFMALPTFFDIFLAKRTATEAALRYAWNGQADYINRLELDEWVTRGIAALLGEVKR